LRCPLLEAGLLLAIPHSSQIEDSLMVWLPASDV
jgi:hypothetical protein